MISPYFPRIINIEIITIMKSEILKSIEKFNENDLKIIIETIELDYETEINSIDDLVQFVKQTILDCLNIENRRYLAEEVLNHLRYNV